MIINPNEKIEMANITFHCRKCGAAFHICCNPNATAFEITKYMKKLLEQPCPYCDTEPIDGNIALSAIRFDTNGGVL